MGPFMTSSENIIKNFFHFNSLATQHLPEIIENFLPAERFFETHLFLTIYDSYILFSFLHDFSFLDPILFSPKLNKASVLQTKIENFSSNSILAQYESGKIDCLKESFAFGQSFMTMQSAFTENNDYEFFIFLKKTNGKFQPIALGEIFGINFESLLDYIWQAYNLKGRKKTFLKCLCRVHGILFRYLEYLNFIERRAIYFTWLMLLLGAGMASLPCIRASLPNEWVTIGVLAIFFMPLYWIPTLPFQILTIFFTLSTKTCHSFFFMPQILFFLYIMCFPLSYFVFVKDTFGNTFETRFNNVKNIFNVQDRENKMSTLPFFVQADHSQYFSFKDFIMFFLQIFILGAYINAASVFFCFSSCFGEFSM